MKKLLFDIWPIIILAVVFLLLGTGLLFYFQASATPSSVSLTQPPQNEQDHKQYSIVTVEVKSDGFYPKNVEVQAGVPTQINFKKSTTFTCIKDVESLDIGMNVYLDKKDNYYTLDDLKPGTYDYNCGMYMFYGTITVK